jgi:hypothetical protein
VQGATPACSHFGIAAPYTDKYLAMVYRKGWEVKL